MGFAEFRARWRPAVSNMRPGALVAALVLVFLLLGASNARANAGDPVSYFGGPVAHSAQGVLVSWGSHVNSLYTDETKGDPGLIKYFEDSSGSAGGIGGVLAQYMDNTGANAAPVVSYEGQVHQITPSVTANTIYDQQIQNELVSQIQNGKLPSPAGQRGLGTIYLVLFPAGDTECFPADSTGYTPCSGTDFCAYHGNARLADGTAVLYAVLPDNTAAPMSQVCGQASTPLANQTSFLSHEWSEAITDPLVGEATSANPPLAWYDLACSGVSACGEIGDKCNPEQALNGGWTVQLEWSNLDSNCESSEPAYSQPTASFTADASPYVSQPVSFDGSGSNDPASNTASMTYQGTPFAISSGLASYAWNWDDGTTDTGPSATATHKFNAPGVYQVSLTVTDNLGFKSTVTKPVEVSSTSPPPPTATTGGPSDITAQSAILTGTIDTGGQPVSYSFHYGTSGDALVQSTPTTHLGPGTHPAAVPPTPVSGLTPTTTYYYRLDVVASGQTYSGHVESFTTADGGSAQGPGSGSSGSGSGSPGPTPTPSPSPTPTPSPGPTPTPSPSPAPAPQLPSAVTGGVSGLSSSGATVAGSVDPNGQQTSYHVEFGTSQAYGHSSLPASAGAGTSSVAVRATLTGLRPRTVYHYRVVAGSAAGTAVGADRTFKTPAAPPRAPRFSFAAPSRTTMSQALAGRLRIRFHCSTACTARFTVTIALPGVSRLQAIPVTFARGSGRVRHAGSGQARLTFTSAARSALRRARSIKLVISGYAVRGNSSPSAPRTARLTLRR